MGLRFLNFAGVRSAGAALAFAAAALVAAPAMAQHPIFGYGLGVDDHGIYHAGDHYYFDNDPSGYYLPHHHRHPTYCQLHPRTHTCRPHHYHHHH